MTHRHTTKSKSHFKIVNRFQIQYRITSWDYLKKTFETWTVKLLYDVQYFLIWHKSEYECQQVHSTECKKKIVKLLKNELKTSAWNSIKHEELVYALILIRFI